MPERRLELPLKGLAESRRTLNPGSVGVVCATSIDAALPLLFGCRLREGKRPPILFVRRDDGERKKVRDFFREHAADLQESLTWKVRRIHRLRFPYYVRPLEGLAQALSNLFDTPQTILLLCRASAVALGDERALTDRLERIAAAAEKGNHIVLLVFYGSGPGDEEFLYRLLSFRHRLGGLAQLTKKKDGCLWQARFWYGLHRFTGQFETALVRDGAGYAAPEAADEEHAVLEDADLVYSASAKLNERTSGLLNLRPVADNEELERIGRRASAATLVFSLESAKEFAPLARTLYTLRKTRGRHLKLIVVPDKAPVRATSLAFLLGCGANVVFETSAGIEFIGMTLAQMRDAVFTRVLPEDFEASLDFVLAAHARGVLDRNEFTELVRRLVTFSETNFVPLNRGTLVTLEPAETLNPEDCLAQFQPKRAGDIACAERLAPRKRRIGARALLCGGTRGTLRPLLPRLRNGRHPIGVAGDRNLSRKSDGRNRTANLRPANRCREDRRRVAAPQPHHTDTGRFSLEEITHATDPLSSPLPCDCGYPRLRCGIFFRSAALPLRCAASLALHRPPRRLQRISFERFA